MNKTLPRIDSHVHIIGDGSSGSGCWLRIRKPYHRFLAQLILSNLGLPASALQSGLDLLYEQWLHNAVRSSSISAVIILAHEKAYNPQGKVIDNIGSFHTPNDYVLSLARKYPGIFIPAIALHPARLDALDELDRCIEQGAAMLKLLPNCQNVDCSDKRYTKFWERLAAAHIPFLSHTGGELSVPVVDKRLADPQLLRHPLECGVTVIAAHCGSRSLLWDAHYTPLFIKMLEKYQNLYGDNSGMNTPFRSSYFRDILSPAVQTRIIHGSDLPIPVSARWNLLRGYITRKDFHLAQSTKNVLERDVRIKQSLGFGEQTFTRILSLIPERIRDEFLGLHNS